MKKLTSFLLENGLPASNVMQALKGPLVIKPGEGVLTAEVAESAEIKG